MCCCPVCVLLTAVCVTDTVLQPKLKKKRSVSKLEVGDTKNVSKYILTHQEPDSNDEMVTKLIKVPHSVALHACCLVTGQLLHTPAGFLGDDGSAESLAGMGRGWKDATCLLVPFGCILYAKFSEYDNFNNHKMIVNISGHVLWFVCFPAQTLPSSGFWVAHFKVYSYLYSSINVRNSDVEKRQRGCFSYDGADLLMSVGQGRAV